MSDPVILIGTDKKSGQLRCVGLFDDIEAAQLKIARNATQDVVYSVWTPQMNDTLPCASIVGLSSIPYKSVG